jgi:TATA-box binding protein (TBP) (component of TFIID and TFIIIB)
MYLYHGEESLSEMKNIEEEEHHHHHPYRISTITATGSVNTEINLDRFYDILHICENDEDDGVTYAEYGKKKSDMVFKGFTKKIAIAKRKITTNSKRFDNQVTFVYRKNEIINGERITALLNIKAFRNGNLQITGLKYIEQGKRVIDILINLLTHTAKTYPDIVVDINALENKNFLVRLINSDFRIGWLLKRELLYKVFMNNFENEVSFEPCIYPGVKIQYFFNRLNCMQNGVCKCETERCIIGKSSGDGDGMCKKITIAVFQSGSVIITGAQNHEQIMETYEFIKGVMEYYRDEIERKIVESSSVEKNNRKKNRKVILLNKKDIIYPKHINIQCQ